MTTRKQGSFFIVDVGWIARSPQFVVVVNVEVVRGHEFLLLGSETTSEEAFEAGLCGGGQEEAVAEGEVEGGHEEANGLHHVPAQLPESEPHEAQCLGRQ